MQRNRDMMARTESIAHVGSWDWDVATDTVTWSDELFRIFKRNPADGAPSFVEHSKFYHPEDMKRLRSAVEAAVSDGTPYELELRAIPKDGAMKVCLARGHAETGPGKRATRLFGSLQDITERKRADEALRDGAHLLDVTGQMAKVGGWELDIATNRVQWTKQTYSIHEIPEGTQFDLSRALLFWDMPGRTALEEAIKRCMENGEPFDLTLPFTSATGRKLWARAMGHAIRSGGVTTKLTGTFQDISDRKRTEDDLTAEHAKLQALTARLDASVEAERRRIAEELHDHVGQVLGLAKLKLSTVALAYGDTKSVAAHKEVKRHLDAAIKFSRNLSAELHPPVLRQLGLGPALKWFAAQTAERENIDCATRIAADLPRLDDATVFILYRAAQELVRNAVRHGSPETITVAFRRGEKRDVLLKVKDDGRGFKVLASGRLAKTKGFGLFSLRERVEEMGGTFTVKSAHGKGTEVTVTVPVKAKKR
jgi:signal transduction histidine kinase